jgi:hypothetical protein
MSRGPCQLPGNASLQGKYARRKGICMYRALPHQRNWKGERGKGKVAVLPDEFEPVSEWIVTLPLFRTEATPLSKSSSAVEFEIGSR